MDSLTQMNPPVKQYFFRDKKGRVHFRTVPEGADPELYLKIEATKYRRLQQTKNGNKPKRRRTTRRRTTRRSKRSQYAAQQAAIGKAMAELVKRANEPMPAPAIPDSWWTIESIGGTTKVDRETGEITFEERE